MRAARPAMRHAGLPLTAALLVLSLVACSSGRTAPSKGDPGDANTKDVADAADVACLKPGDSFEGPAGTGVVADGNSCPVGYCYLCGILDLPFGYPAQCPTNYCAPRSGEQGECTRICLDAGAGD
jgi:hypothetical protein